jgi:hypothetical protein
LQIAKTLLLNAFLWQKYKFFLQHGNIPCMPKTIISHQSTSILCRWSWAKESSLLKLLNHKYDGDNYTNFHSTSTIDWDQQWILALSYSNLNPLIAVWILNRNCVTNMHIFGHVFTILKYNLLTKHPTFIEFMDEYYYIRTQNWIEDDEPLNKPPIPQGRDFFLFNSIACPPFTKNF